MPPNSTLSTLCIRSRDSGAVRASVQAAISSRTSNASRFPLSRYWSRSPAMILCSV
ncbi:hypothetical protein STENM327S_07200 [Streptomyces tendae]